MKYKLNLSEIEKYYTITEDGRVYNKTTNRWMTQSFNNYGYIYIWITQGVDHIRQISAHQLVAHKFIGPPPAKNYEIDHIDQNRTNNHYTNLQWITHSANIQKSYDKGRDHFWRGKHRPSPDLETRFKMALAKNKKVLFKFKDQQVIYNSIADAASCLGTYRKRIYLSIKHNKPIKGGYLSVITE